MFPIFTVSGKPVAFAGRILKKKDNVGKYVNSPDSLIYSKTNELYGLFQAKQAISRADMCYLVEGQMDVISMHQSGIENVVASGGTALTKPQIRLIQRFTSNITVLYDGDAAGIHAALRGIDMFLEEGFNVKVVLLPEGEDPDSYAQSHDSTEFIHYIETHKTDFIRFKSTLLSKEAGEDPYKRATLIKDITSSIAFIPDMITRQVYIKDCAERLHMSEKVLTNEVVNIRRKRAEEREKAKLEVRSESTDVVRSETPESNSSQNGLTGEAGLTVQRSHSATVSQRSGLETNFYNLFQLVVKYGERPIEVDEEQFTIGELIIYTLEGDQVQAPRPVYQTMIDEFKAHCKEPGFKAETFFKFHPDPSVSALAVDMIADPYRFAEMNNEMQLGELVKRLLFEIKLTVINGQIDELEQRMKNAQAAGDINAQLELLKFQPMLLNQRNEICKILGNRVIQ